jgi:FMN phosphatase YigB (HAD superfamily)
MGQTRAIFFWLSGVIPPSFQTILSRALADLGKSGVNLPGLVEIQQAWDGLVLGKIDEHDFCQKVVEITKLEAEPAILREKLLAEISPNPQVIQTIKLLPEKYDLWLLVEIPRSWFERVSERLEVGECFSVERTFFLSESGLTRLVPEIFYHLPNTIHLPMQECLIIDANSKRAVQALNHGLPAALFTGAKQLEREFTMRYFIEKPQPVHKPAV